MHFAVLICKNFLSVLKKIIVVIFLRIFYNTCIRLVDKDGDYNDSDDYQNNSNNNSGYNDGKDSYHHEWDKICDTIDEYVKIVPRLIAVMLITMQSYFHCGYPY